MTYTLAQAAKATGRARSTILRAIQKGRISAEKDVHDQWGIEPAELHRVYPAVASDSAETDASATERTGPSAALIQHLERQIEDLRQDRDAWREQAQRLLLGGPDRRSWWQRVFGGGKAE